MLTDCNHKSQLNLSRTIAGIAWQRHAQAAKALLEYRGLDILQTPVGARLVRLVYTQEVRNIVYALFRIWCSQCTALQMLDVLSASRLRTQSHRTGV